MPLLNVDNVIVVTDAHREEELCATDDPVRAFNGDDLSIVSAAEISAFYSIVINADFGNTLHSLFAPTCGDEDGHVTVRLRPPVVERLAALTDSDVATIARRKEDVASHLAQDFGTHYGNAFRALSESEVGDLLRLLKTRCQTALDAGLSVFLWNDGAGP